jgi:hypothetical protein
VVGVVGAWAYYTFGSFDPSAVPNRLRVFGRTYRDHGDALVNGEIAHAARHEVLEPTIGDWPVVLPWDRPVDGAGTPTIVWLRVGPDRYAAFALSGGP